MLRVTDTLPGSIAHHANLGNCGSVRERILSGTWRNIVQEAFAITLDNDLVICPGEMTVLDIRPVMAFTVAITRFEHCRDRMI